MNEIDELILIDAEIAKANNAEKLMREGLSQSERERWDLYRRRDAITTKYMGYIVGEKLYSTQEYIDAVHTQLPHAILPPYYILAAAHESGSLSVYNSFIDHRPFYGIGGTHIPEWQARHLRRSGEIVEVQPEPQYRD